jgi:hypothetical protein
VFLTKTKGGSNMSKTSEKIVITAIYIIIIITLVTLAAVLRLPHHSETIITKTQIDKNKLKNILLQQYIGEHSKFEFNKFKNKEIVEKLNKILDEHYKEFTILNTILSKNKLKLLTIAIMEIESSFTPYICSKAGAIGLMQILPSDENLKLLKQHIKFYSVKELFTIENNIYAGLILLNHHCEIAYKRLKSQKDFDIVNVLKKGLNIYSHDSSGNYTINVISKYLKLKHFVDI